MPKQKKTRKQKKLADVRRQTVPVATHTAITEQPTHAREEHISVSVPKVSRPQATVSHTIATADYRHVASDVRKTILLTVSIIAIELVIKYSTGI